MHARTDLDLQIRNHDENDAFTPDRVGTDVPTAADESEPAFASAPAGPVPGQQFEYRKAGAFWTKLEHLTSVNFNRNKLSRVSRFAGQARCIVVITAVSTNVPQGEQPEISIRMPDGTVRDTTLAHLGPPPAEVMEGADSSEAAAPALQERYRQVSQPHLKKNKLQTIAEGKNDRNGD